MFWSTEWQMYFWDSVCFQPWSVAQMVFCCVYMYGWPPRGQEKSAVGEWEWRSRSSIRKLALSPPITRWQSTPQEVCKHLCASQTGADDERQNHHGLLFLHTCPRHTQSSGVLLLFTQRSGAYEIKQAPCVSTFLMLYIQSLIIINASITLQDQHAATVSSI